MKTKIILLTGILIFLFSSCENDSPGLKVDPSSLSFTSDMYEAQIFLTNDNEDELSWEVKSKPDWIDLSKESGILATETDTIFVTADIGMEIGNYSDDIIIKYDDKEIKVSVSLEITHKIEIFPGVGAAKINLRDPLSKVIEVYGQYDHAISREIYYPNESEPFELHRVIRYDDIKATFSGRGTPDDLVADYEVFSIEVEAPYDGLTEELIGIGSSTDDVVAAFGQPTVIEYGYYKYKSIGIHFEYDEATSIVISIIVYIDNIWID